jgi:hypothetical protein
LLCLFFLLRYLGGRSYLNLLWMFLIGVLGMMSDHLILIQFFIPVASLLLFTGIIGRKRQYFIAVLVAGASFLIGNIFFLNVIHKMAHVPEFQRGVLPRQESVRNFLDHFSTYFHRGRLMGMIIILAAVSWLLHSVKVVSLLLRRDFFRMFYTGFIAVAAAAMIFGPPLAGMYRTADTIRYTIHGFYLLIFHLPFVLPFSFSPKAGKIAVPVFSLVVFGIILYFSPHFRPGLKQFAGYKPAVARLTDQYSDKLLGGIATYWVAKQITMFSGRNVCAVSVYDNLLPYGHESSEVQYLGLPGEEKPVFNFVVDVIPDEIVTGPAIDSVSGFGHTLYLVEPFRFYKTEEGKIRLYR